MNKIRPIALYLPQFHPIPENDAWWGRGFTEWTNVVQAKPLFKGHYQPRIPADLGFYDLRVPEVREQQAELAREHGIYGFCYYHYWFGNGKQLLERPFNEVLASGKPNFPFMLCWANETWQGVWHGVSQGRTLIQQLYPGKQDYINHFNYLINAFADPRYIKIEQKPVFYVYQPQKIPDLNLFVDVFRECAQRAGLDGLYLLADHSLASWDPRKHHFDGMVSNNFHRIRMNINNKIFKHKSGLFGRIENKLNRMLKNNNVAQRNKPYIIDYKTMTRLVSQWPDLDFDYFPKVVPDWDNSPRSGNQSMIIRNSSPALWQQHFLDACSYSIRYPQEKQLVFIKSWNEWAESNYLEPDVKFGYQYLDAVKSVLSSINNV